MLALAPIVSQIISLSSLAAEKKAAADPSLANGILAVLELDTKLKGQEREHAVYLADRVRAAAKQALPGLTVITHENLIALLEASGKKPEDCVGQCDTETGRLLGADLVVSGQLLRFDNEYKLSLKLHETKAGRLLSTAIGSGRSLDALDDGAAQAAADLFAPEE